MRKASLKERIKNFGEALAELCEDHGFALDHHHEYVTALLDETQGGAIVATFFGQDTMPEIDDEEA